MEEGDRNGNEPSGGDVGDSPASLLLDTLLGGGEKGEKGRESSRSDDHLSLKVVSGNDVSNGSKSRSLDGGRVVPMRGEKKR